MAYREHYRILFYKYIFWFHYFITEASYPDESKTNNLNLHNMNDASGFGDL